VQAFCRDNGGDVRMDDCMGDCKAIVEQFVEPS